nr:MAG TPA: hypothetical protein [Caudoviricetes sp.]
MKIILKINRKIFDFLLTNIENGYIMFLKSNEIRFYKR